jgi:hypothetical protein
MSQPSTRQTGAVATTVSYYMVVFGSQRHPNWPRFSHSFAAVVGAREDEASPTAIEDHIISWLPQTKVIVPLRPWPEKGKNFGLEATLDWVTRRLPRVQSRITAWGPFRVEPRLYTAFVARADQLERGLVQYIAADGGFRPDHATNCIHALSDLGLTSYLLKTYAAHGREASRRVIKLLRQRRAPDRSVDRLPMGRRAPGVKPLSDPLRDDHVMVCRSVGANRATILRPDRWRRGVRKHAADSGFAGRVCGSRSCLARGVNEPASGPVGQSGPTPVGSRPSVPRPGSSQTRPLAGRCRCNV